MRLGPLPVGRTRDMCLGGWRRAMLVTVASLFAVHGTRGPRQKGTMRPGGGRPSGSAGSSSQRSAEPPSHSFHASITTRSVANK